MGQKKNNRRNTVATVDNDARYSKAEVTPLRPANTPSPSATATLKPNSTRSAGPTHEQIARRAHEIWIRNGRKPGQDRQNWLEAEAQLKKELGGR